MVKAREILNIIIAIIIMAIVIGFINNELKIASLPSFLVLSAVIILISVLAQKITAAYIDVETKIKLWEFRRWWISKWAELKRPIPIGLILPLLLAFISSGIIKFLAFLQFDSAALPSKAVKKYGIKRFSGIMEWDDALISFYSLIPLLALAIILAIVVKFMPFAFFTELSKYSFFYALSNLIPIGQLCGTKMFFGSRPLFVFSWVLVIITGLIIFL